MQNSLKEMGRKVMKGMAITLVSAMILTAIPSSAVPVLAASVKKVVKTVIEPKMVYEDVYGFYNDVSMVKNSKNKYGIINLSGKTVLDCKYDSMAFTKDAKNFIAGYNGGKWYLLNLKGKVIKTYGTYDKMSEFEEGYFYGSTIGDTEDITVIKKNGTKLFSFSDYNYMYMVNNNKNIFICNGSYEYSLYDLNGKKNCSYGKYDNLYETKAGYFQGCSEIKDEEGNTTYEYSVVKTSGSYLFKPGQFRMITASGSKWIVADDSYQWYIYTSDGKLSKSIGSYSRIYESSISGYLYVYANDGTLGIMKDDGTIVIKTGKYCGSSGFYGFSNKNLFMLKDQSGKWYTLNKSGKVVTTIGKYSWCYAIEKDLYCVSNDFNTSSSEYGVVDNTGKLIVSLGKYTQLNYLSEQNCITAKDKNGKYYLLNKKGKVIASLGEQEYVTDINGLCMAYGSDGYSFYSSDGTKLLKNKKISEWGAYNDTYLPVEINNKWGVYQIYDSVTAPAKVSKVTVVKGKKQIKVTVKKVSGAKGYQIQYSTKKNFKNAKKVNTTKKTVTIKKLQKNKKYYVRVKAYKVDGTGKKVLSKKWSAVKTVKTK